MFTYKYPMFAMTVDVIVADRYGFYLFIKRGGEYEHGKLALAGGFIDINETARQAAKRELKEETGLDFPEERFQPAMLADRVNRDERQRTVSVVFYLMVDDLSVYHDDLVKLYENGNGDDATGCLITNVWDKDEMAFDHYDIMQQVVFGYPYMK